MEVKLSRDSNNMADVVRPNFIRTTRAQFEGGCGGMASPLLKKMTKSIPSLHTLLFKTA